MVSLFKYTATLPPRFTDDASYLVLSSLVSFYGPIVVILYAYRRIYIAASEQLRGLREGSKTLRS